MIDVLYRYEDISYASSFDEDGRSGSSTIRVELREFRILRRTPKGCWIDLTAMPFSLIDHPDERFVLNSATKRFACETIEDARTSFLARKRRQLSIYLARADRARRAIVELEAMTRLTEVA